MRVIAGVAKGKKLFTPGSRSPTRPITDRAKESLFNIIKNQMANSSFLDLFAGTGSVGIEALSRGAKVATFVERCPTMLKVMQKNLLITNFKKQANVIRGNAFRYLAKGNIEPLNTIFVAPPQYGGLWLKALYLLDDRPKILASDAMIIIQIDPSEFEYQKFTHFFLAHQRSYSNVLFCFYSRIYPNHPGLRENDCL